MCASRHNFGSGKCNLIVEQHPCYSEGINAMFQFRFVIRNSLEPIPCV